MSLQRHFIVSTQMRVTKDFLLLTVQIHYYCGVFVFTNVGENIVVQLLSQTRWLIEKSLFHPVSVWFTVTQQVVRDLLLWLDESSFHFLYLLDRLPPLAFRMPPIALNKGFFSVILTCDHCTLKSLWLGRNVRGLHLAPKPSRCGLWSPTLFFVLPLFAVERG